MKNLHFLRLHFERLCGISERTLLEFLKCSQLIDKLCIARLINSPHITPFFCFFFGRKMNDPIFSKECISPLSNEKLVYPTFCSSSAKKPQNRVNRTVASIPEKIYGQRPQQKHDKCIPVGASRKETKRYHRTVLCARIFCPVLWSLPNCSLRGHRKHQPRLLSSFFPGGTACFIIFGWRFKDVFLTTFYDVCHRSVD